MPSLALPELFIWFAHCPKAGGTSVESFMVDRWGDAVGHLHWGWDLWWRRGGWRLASPPNSPQHLIWSDALTVLPRQPDAVFAMVRDPVTRMASEYRWQRGGRRGTWLGKAVAHLPFSLWLRVMLSMARRRPYSFDNHFRLQSEFIPDTAKVFRLEDGLQPALDWLSDIAGETDRLKEEAPHRLATGSAPELGPADKARIADAFGEDYDRFGYVPPSCIARRDRLDWLAEKLAPLLIWLDRRGAL